MKRFLSIFILCLVLLSGCGPQVQPAEPGNFYYLRSEFQYHEAYGAIAPEVRETCNCGDLTQLVSTFISGPQSDDLKSPFPLGTRVIRVTNAADMIYVEMNAVYATLTGYELTVANACLAKTLLDCTGASSVQISAENATLGGAPHITLTADSLLLWDLPTDKTGGQK